MDDTQNDDADQVFSSDVSFQCPTCRAHVETRMAVPEPNWTAAEDISELSSEGISNIHCGSCGSEFEVYVFFTHGECNASFKAFPDASIDADCPMYWPPAEEWVDPGSTPDPYAVYDASYQQLCGLLDALGESDGGSLINRMIFSQHISAMEAYLCDTLVNAVSTDQDALTKLLSEDKELKSVKLPLVKVLTGGEVAKKYATDYLKKVLYHDLKKVDFLYHCALGVRIMDHANDNKTLLEMVLLRHDCVHRNGFDQDGNPPTKFTKDYVREKAELIKRLIDRVDEGVHKL